MHWWRPSRSNSAPVTEDHHYPPHLRSIGVYHAGGRGQPLPDEQGRAGKQDSHLTGGRAAEESMFHCITTGASNDIEQATKLARACITRYGMSEDFDMVALETVTNQYLGGDTSLACSEQTAAQIDRLVVGMVKKEHAKACDILNTNIGKLHELAKFLYERETITGDEFMEILNAPERIPSANS